VFGIVTAEGEARLNVDRELKSDNTFPLLGILVLRTYAFYHGDKKFLAFLASLYVVRLPLPPHWIFKANRVILGRGRYHYRYCLPFRTHSAMYTIHLFGLLFHASSSL
jgi:hypothetical protein